jgi:hypothetical protein
MKASRSAALIAAFLFGAFLPHARVSAQVLPSARPAGRTASPRRGEEFGTSSDTVLSIGSSAFVARFPYDQLYMQTDGSAYFVSDDSFVFDAVAAVALPAGVVIDTVEFVGCSSADGDWDVYLFADHGVSAPDTIAAFTTTAGCGYQVLDLSYPTANNLDNYYRFLVHQRPGAPIPDVWFRGVNVWYRRSVSPAPAQASFADVPVDDSGFQYVEALAASGITGGCGGGNFCPDVAVTRRQMAIFLAKALGLHWPN